LIAALTGDQRSAYVAPIQFTNAPCYCSGLAGGSLLIASPSRLALSLSFLGTRIEQMPRRGAYGNDAVEAVVFARTSLDPSNWALVWRSVKLAVQQYGSQSVTFHFPIDDCDYVRDAFVLRRLQEAFARASDAGLRGLVVHSNRIRPISSWRPNLISDERQRVVACLHDVVESSTVGHTWLALENVPLMDNYGVEIDPLFCFAADFGALAGTRIRVVWDICHSTNSIATIRHIGNGLSVPWADAAYAGVDWTDFRSLMDRIAHWHFSAFRGFANPREGTICVEGVHPNASTLGEPLYARLLTEIAEVIVANAHVVLEVREADYTARLVAPEVCRWITGVLNGRREAV
jgi:hypothetical protein